MQFAPIKSYWYIYIYTWELACARDRKMHFLILSYVARERANTGAAFAVIEMRCAFFSCLVLNLIPSSAVILHRYTLIRSCGLLCERYNRSAVTETHLHRNVTRKIKWQTREKLRKKERESVCMYVCVRGQQCNLRDSHTWKYSRKARVATLWSSSSSFLICAIISARKNNENVRERHRLKIRGVYLCSIASFPSRKLQRYLCEINCVTVLRCCRVTSGRNNSRKT